MSSRKPILRSDQRGAIVVMGLFMAVFLVGIMYYIVGIGDAVLHKQRMQDAADAAAFSAAVMHARGMNILALINIIMAALVAILVALKLVEILCFVAIGICTAVSWFFPGAAAFVGPLTGLQQLTNSAHSQLSNIIFNIIKVLNCAQMGIRKAMPLAAQVRVIADVPSAFGSPVKFAFVMPIYEELPTKNGTFEGLCGKGGEYAAKLAMAPFAFIPDIIKDGLGGALAGLTSGGASYFCGDAGSGGGDSGGEGGGTEGGGSGDVNEEDLTSIEKRRREKEKKEPPKTEVERFEQRPVMLTDAMQQCRAEVVKRTKADKLKPVEANRSPVCQEASKDEAALSAVDPATGQCVPLNFIDGATEMSMQVTKDRCESIYNQFEARARLVCGPDGEKHEPLEKPIEYGKQKDGEIKRYRYKVTKKVVRYRRVPMLTKFRIEEVSVPEDTEFESYGVGLPPIGLGDSDPGKFDNWENNRPCQNAFGPNNQGVIEWTGWDTNPNNPLCRQKYEQDASFMFKMAQLKNSDESLKFKVDGDGYPYFDHTYLEVSRFYGCSRKFKEVITNNDKLSGVNNDSVGNWSVQEARDGYTDETEGKAAAATSDTGVPIDSDALETVDSSGQSSDGGGGEDNSFDCANPVAQDMKDEAVLGGETFQIRGFAIGEKPSERGKQGVEYVRALRDTKLANHRKEAGRTKGMGVLETLGQVAVAQAEYYFAGGKKNNDETRKLIEDRNEWLWHMYWRARFRRVRLESLSNIPVIGDIADAVIVH